MSRVQTQADLDPFLPYLSQIPASSVPELALDCEASQGLDRNEDITHLSMKIKALDHTWIFCTVPLGDIQFFDIPNSGGLTLRSILESKDIISIWFDIRADCDALHGLYNIKLGNVIDIQLMAVATKFGSRERLPGLRKCVFDEGLAFMTQAEKNEWVRNKDEGGRYLKNRYWLLAENPLSEIVKQYTAGDVSCLFGLYDTYLVKYPTIEGPLQNSGIQVNLRQMVATETRNRIVASESPDFVRGSGYEMSTSPNAFLNLEIVSESGLVQPPPPIVPWVPRAYVFEDDDVDVNGATEERVPEGKGLNVFQRLASKISKLSLRGQRTESPTQAQHDPGTWDWTPAPTQDEPPIETPGAQGTFKTMYKNTKRSVSGIFK